MVVGVVVMVGVNVGIGVVVMVGVGIVVVVLDGVGVDGVGEWFGLRKHTDTWRILRCKSIIDKVSLKLHKKSSKTFC